MQLSLIDINMFKPKVNWLSLAFIIDATLTVSLLATCGIYWASEINKKLKESTLSIRAKSMQRRMNNLLVIQVFVDIVSFSSSSNLLPLRLHVLLCFYIRPQ